MDNTIFNQNLGGDNNSILSLSFRWNAIFSDGSQIYQFNKDGTENRFKLVKDKFDDLVYFNLTNDKGITFTVDLKNGLIGYNYLALPYIENIEKKKNIRLIIFRRHRGKIGTQDLKEKEHIITYHLGYQYLDNNGYNRKVVLQINNNGEFIIEG